jgi:hypothetical protein
MNRLVFRVVSVLLLAGVFILSSSSCGGSSAKSSSTKSDVVPRDLYIINANTGAIDQDFPDVNVGDAAVAAMRMSRSPWKFGSGPRDGFSQTRVATTSSID